MLEPRVPAPAGTLATFKALSRRYSPERVLWRYDPIVLSNFTPPEHHTRTFRALCRQLEGGTSRRCCLSCCAANCFLPPPSGKHPSELSSLNCTCERMSVIAFAVSCA